MLDNYTNWFRLVGDFIKLSDYFAQRVSDSKKGEVL